MGCGCSSGVHSQIETKRKYRPNAPWGHPSEGIAQTECALPKVYSAKSSIFWKTHTSIAQVTFHDFSCPSNAPAPKAEENDRRLIEASPTDTKIVVDFQDDTFACLFDGKAGSRCTRVAHYGPSSTRCLQPEAPSGFAQHTRWPQELIVLSRAEHDLEATVRPTVLDAARQQVEAENWALEQWLEHSSMWTQPPNLQVVKSGDITESTEEGSESKTQSNLGDIIDLADIADLSCAKNLLADTDSYVDEALAENGMDQSASYGPWDNIATGDSASYPTAFSRDSPEEATPSEEEELEELLRDHVVDSSSEHVTEMLMPCEAVVDEKKPMADDNSDAPVSMAIALQERLAQHVEEKQLDCAIIDCMDVSGCPLQSAPAAQWSPKPMSLVHLETFDWTKLIESGKPVPLDALPLLAPNPCASEPSCHLEHGTATSTHPKYLTSHASSSGRTPLKTPIRAAAEAALAFPWRQDTQSLLCTTQAASSAAPAAGHTEPSVPTSSVNDERCTVSSMRSATKMPGSSRPISLPRPSHLPLPAAKMTSDQPEESFSIEALAALHERKPSLRSMAHPVSLAPLPAIRESKDVPRSLQQTTFASRSRALAPMPRPRYP